MSCEEAPTITEKLPGSTANRAFLSHNPKTCKKTCNNFIGGRSIRNKNKKVNGESVVI